MIDTMPQDTILKTFEKFSTLLRDRNCLTMVPLLPLLYLGGKPYSLKNHFPLEPMFNLTIPRQLVWKTGRQIGKTQGLAAQGILQSIITPFSSTLLVTPLYEQCRRLSANYVNPFIEMSPLRSMLQNSRCERSVLQKSFINGANLFFSFAFLNVTRIRGLSAQRLKIDEIQDMDWDFVPIIQECLKAAQNPPGTTQYSGTPKTLDNTMNALWEISSQAEWAIKCEACNYINIPAADHDILKMLGRETIVCAKCGRPVNPRTGHWWHRYPDKRALFSGYHIPQIIIPMHYELDETGSNEKWHDIIRASEGYQGYSSAKFYNEVLGESCDVGVKLVTITDLKNASTLSWNNDYHEALKRAAAYPIKALGVDWGGGGLDEISMTGISIVGMTPQGKLDVIYMERLHSNLTHHEEASTILHYFLDFHCNFLAHDFGGAGNVREAIIIQAGLPITQVIPMLYVRASTKAILSHNAPNEGSPRHYWSLDKARSLVLLTGMIKTGGISFPKYESCKDLLSDFMALIEDKHQMPQGSDIFLVTRVPKLSDDICHAINFACVSIWHHKQQWPDLSKQFRIKLTREQRDFAQPNVAKFTGA